MKRTKKIGDIFGERKKSLMTFSFCLILFALCNLPVLAQGQNPPAPPSTSPSPSPRATPVKPKVYNPKAPVYTPYPVPAPTPAPKIKRRIFNASEGPAEKSIAVDSKVVVSLCVSGTLKVNGWDREEVRAFVDGGSSLGFKVQMLNKKVAGLTVLGFDPKKVKEFDLDECLAGETIELDVPFDATVSIDSREESEIAVDSISTVRIKNNAGSLSLRNIRNGVEASTSEGDITAERIDGQINLFTSTGRVIVFGSSPNEIGNRFFAKTHSGAISLQNVEQTSLEVSSITGSLRFTGKMEAGGQYKFNTTNGKIELNLPMNTSCKILATYGGSFDLQLPFKDIINNKQPGIQKVIAVIGDGDCSTTVTTYTGSILIKPIKK